jgi:flagellar biosynthesis anti-sigma factor FlgM
MNREPQSGSDSSAGTGLLEPLSATATAASPEVNAPIAVRGGKLAAEALSFPDFRLARVKALKAQIAAGTYKVPAPKVAAALLDYMLERERVEAGEHRRPNVGCPRADHPPV